MEFNNKEIRDLAEKIYNLDSEVYEVLGSSLGRVFNGDKERCITDIMQLLHERRQGYKVRGELALISNMARTITDKSKRKEIMIKYDQILQEVMSIPTSFGDGDILDPKIADLNTMNLGERFGENDHLIICIGRTYGCGGNEIGFKLADELKMNFYDVSIMNEVLRRMEGDYVPEEASAFSETKRTPIQWIKEFVRYHGLSKSDIQFFDSSKLLVQKAKEEDFIVMGRFADAVLTNNHIPHISIFITAPERRRIQRIIAINNGALNAKQAKQLIEREDKRHHKKYKFYTGRKWSKASNYDLCINSASYGIQGSVDLIRKMIRNDN
ncbi:MAG: cytidylate kinase-like family protein [Agathobacter sp.]|nr:cytidylate kinase-like family protein [Agathobacter sp.]MDY3796744.1 cytidylate kinase-like family protein [Agathobacter sp.]